MYASQQGAWQNSLETGIFDTLPEILGGWWGIDSTAEAREQLDYLCEKGFRYYWPTVLEAFRLDGRERQDELLQQRMTSQKDYDKASSQLENLRETFDELLSCGVVASKEELSGCNVTGWDAGRIVFLARPAARWATSPKRRHGRTSDGPTRWRMRRAGRGANWR